MTERSGFVFDGNLLCLDFVNTRMMSGGRPVDRLTDVDALLRWLCAADALRPADAARAKAAWTPTDAALVFRSAIGLRATLRSVLEMIVAGEEMDRRATRRLVDPVNEILAASPTVSSLRYERGGIRTEERVVGDDPRAVLAPVAASIADLFTGDRIDDVGQCSDPTCVIFFHDLTKNHSRRWCSMSRCGNRAKVAAHRRRAKQARRPTPGRG